MSIIVVNAGFVGALASTLTGYAALLAVMVATGIILCLTVVAEGSLNEKITMVFSLITGSSCRAVGAIYVDGLTALVSRREADIARHCAMMVVGGHHATGYSDHRRVVSGDSVDDG